MNDGYKNDDGQLSSASASLSFLASLQLDLVEEQEDDLNTSFYRNPNVSASSTCPSPDPNINEWPFLNDNTTFPMEPHNTTPQLMLHEEEKRQDTISATNFNTNSNNNTATHASIENGLIYVELANAEPLINNTVKQVQ